MIRAQENAWKGGPRPGLSLDVGSCEERGQEALGRGQEGRATKVIHLLTHFRQSPGDVFSPHPHHGQHQPHTFSFYTAETRQHLKRKISSNSTIGMLNMEGELGCSNSSLSELTEREEFGN